MDLSDMRPILLELGVKLGRTLDVGCGTGRLHTLCESYQGVDISPSMVAYCEREGIPAKLIDGPQDIEGEYEWVTCLSVFTHISREDRRAYLQAFRKVASNLLVDILPGDEGGGISATYASVENFESDLSEFDYTIQGVNETVSPDEVLHRLYRC